MLVDIPGTRSILTTNAVREYKIVVVGPRKVGKSASVVRFLTKRFINEYVENTDMPCKRVTEVDGEPLRVNIQDTSDKGMRLSAVEHYFRWADAIMMVYSITDRDSFHQLKRTAARIMEKTLDLEEKEHSRIPPLVVVGNKGDLDYIRKVSQKEGFELAEKLHCDFFEASAREGWSKLIARTDISHLNCSPSADTDTLSVFAGAIANVGMVGVPHHGNAVCTATHHSRGRSPFRSNEVEEFKSSKSTSIRRWGSFNTIQPIRRETRSHSTVGLGSRLNNTNSQTAFKTYQAVTSSGSSPAYSEDDSDESKLLGQTFAQRSRKERNHGGFIGRLSPRLGRKFSRVTKVDENQSKTSLKDTNNNNNNKQKKSPANGIAFGLSSTFLTNPRLGEVLINELNNSQSNSNNSCGASSISSASTSTTGSTESLVLCDQDLDNRKDSLAAMSSGNAIPGRSPPPPPIIAIPDEELKLQEHEYGSSEPFLHLCRWRHRGRGRSRSPSNKLMNGLKKIRSLASDQHNHQNRQQVSTALLSIPVLKI